MNLIEKYGSYDAAKAKQQELSKIAADPQLLLVGKIIKEIGEIEIALLEYRRQHNIFEPDDYIIHDGELKVFAMWSSAVEGCAYIGYAYAENGEMAHKDEFRHATDAEIKAGKRLEVKSLGEVS
ncbi:hypothetical protein N5D11_14140 [Acinetobacter johnsonii]|uniref:Uncharacterized protein n=1 Tax=Acinetobacter johnsonii TaxID=40214 RepID=A0AA42LFK7_ACIJO|nr:MULTISPECIES: hypothetical protein [Acinetobacter]MDH0657239.1 hypothetical protein [Acinetobacter johnsonii]RGD89530.1 hypothetical protein DYI96_12830 [Acinetobacter sp. SWAC57]